LTKVQREGNKKIKIYLKVSREYIRFGEVKAEFNLSDLQNEVERSTQRIFARRSLFYRCRKYVSSLCCFSQFAATLISLISMLQRLKRWK